MLRKQNKLITAIKSVISLGLIGATLVTAGCSNGGGSTTNSIPATTLGGVAATGVAMTGATVKLTDSTGASKTAITDASGNYTLDVTGMTAPFVILASGMVGDGAETLVSMVATQPTAGQAVVANVTPLTNALAAALDSTGDPLHMAANVSAEAVNITASKLTTATTNLQTALGPLLTQLNISPTMNFISGTLTANGTGVDKLLDSLQITVAPGGTANGGTTVALKDGNGTVTTQSLSLATPPTALPTLTSVADYTVINTAQAALTACFAVTPASSRAAASQCTSLVAGGYLNDGKSGSVEFAFASSAAFDNAIAEPPQVIYFIDATHALVKLVLDLTDGSHYALTTVAANTINGWVLLGNQENYFTFVNGVAEKREELNTGTALPGAYTSGLNLYFDKTAGNAATVFANANSYVRVTGPGLPATVGIILQQSAGTCAYLTIQSETGTPAATGSLTGHKNSCVSYFRLTGIALDGSTSYDSVFDGTTPSTNHNQNFRNGKLTDANILAIHPFDAYTVTVHDGATNTDIAAFTRRLRSRPLSLTELPSVHWNVISAATKASLIPSNAAAFTGGASFPASWIPQPLTAPVTTVNVQVRNSGTLVANNPRVSPLASSATVTAGANFPSVATMGTMTCSPANTISSCKDFSWVGLNARNRLDLQIFTSTTYSAY